MADYCANCCAELEPLPTGGRKACTQYHGRHQGFYVTDTGPPIEPGFEALPIVGAKSGKTFYVYGVRT